MYHFNREGIDTMKASEVIKLIKNCGWKLNRTKGSHKHFKHPSLKGLVTVPAHGSRDLHPNILNSISKMTGLSF